MYRLICIYTPLYFNNVMISLAILLIKFYSLRLTLNNIYSCYQRQMVKHNFMPFPAPRRLNTAALACLPPLPHSF